MTTEIHPFNIQNEVFSLKPVFIYCTMSYLPFFTNQLQTCSCFAQQGAPGAFSAFSTLCFLVCLSTKELLVEFNLGFVTSFLCLLLPSPVSVSPFTAFRQAKDFQVLLDSGIMVICCLQRGLSQSHHSLSLRLLCVLDIGSLLRALIGWVKQNVWTWLVK